MEFAGKTIIVTGATAGIGRSTAHLLSAYGANLVLVARGRAVGGELVDKLGSDSTVFLAADVADESAAKQAVGLAEEVFGGVDALVNNAGIDYARPIADVTLKEAQRVVSVNFLGSFLMLQAAANAMRDRGGAIVNVSSRLASVGIPEAAVYSGSKGAVEALSRTAAVELAPQGIRVNVVAPGITNTPMIESWIDDQPEPNGFRKTLLKGIPLQAFAEPDDVANAVAFVASDRAAHITGTVIRVDGGYTAK